MSPLFTGSDAGEGSSYPDEGAQYQDSARLLCPAQGTGVGPAGSCYQSCAGSHTWHTVLSGVGAVA